MKLNGTLKCLEINKLLINHFSFPLLSRFINRKWAAIYHSKVKAVTDTQFTIHQETKNVSVFTSEIVNTKEGLCMIRPLYDAATKLPASFKLKFQQIDLSEVIN